MMNITKIVEENISFYGESTTFPEHVLITEEGVFISWSNIGKAILIENVLANYCALNKCTREKAKIQFKNSKFYDLESKTGEYSLWGTVTEFMGRNKMRAEEMMENISLDNFQ